jgi:hypothetical protein
MSTEKANGLMGNQTYELPPSIIVPQPTTIQHALILVGKLHGNRRHEAICRWSNTSKTDIYDTGCELE